MYEIIKSIINAGGYELEKLLHKIDLYHLEDKLTDEQRTELVALARENANAHNSYGAWQDVTDGLAAGIAALQAALTALTARVAALENGTAQPEPEPEEPTPEMNSNGTVAWSEYVPPTGAHNMYNAGDKVRTMASGTSATMTPTYGRRLRTRPIGRNSTDAQGQGAAGAPGAAAVRRGAAGGAGPAGAGGVDEYRMMGVIEWLA